MSVADVKAALAQAYASGELPTLESVSPDGRNESWKLGNALFILPVVPSDASPELEYALRIRREASLTVKCDECGAAFDVGTTEESGVGQVSDGFFAHRGNCLACDYNLQPLLKDYYAMRRKTTFDESIDQASRKTLEKVKSGLPDRVDLPATAAINERFNDILDEKLATAKRRCAHLYSQPVQTWHISMWDDIWRCDECALRYALTSRQAPVLSDLEEHSCDYCRRYSPTFLQTDRHAHRDLRYVRCSMSTLRQGVRDI